MGKEIIFFDEEDFRERMAQSKRLRGVELSAYGQISSTNDRARELLLQSPCERIVTAEAQTGGRGQYGRRWESDLPGNIYCTFVFPFLPPVARLRDLSRQLALAIRRDFRDRFSIPLVVKPPNDLLLQGGKVAGILLESVIEARGFLVGIGFNMVQSEKLQAACSQRIGSLWPYYPLSHNDVLFSLAEVTFDLISWLARDEI